MSDNGAPNRMAATECDIEVLDQAKVYKEIETYKSEDNVISALGSAKDAEDGLILLEYKKPGSNITTLQLAIQKSKLLPGGLVKYIFDCYVFAKIARLPEDDINRVVLEHIFRDEPQVIPNLVDLRPDIHGFTLLHYAILYNSSAKTVKQLIDILPNALYASENSPITPLHLAILAPLRIPNGYRSQEFYLNLLLDADNTVEKTTLFDPIDLRGANNKVLKVPTPLHLAVLFRRSSMEIKALIKADCTGDQERKICKRSVVAAYEQCYPLLQATKNDLPEDVVKVLVDADWSADGKTRINVLPSFVKGELPERYVPIIINENTLSYLLYPDDKILPKTENIELECSIPNKYLPELSANPAMQRYLNKFWCVTYAFAYLVLFDLYLHILAVACFMWVLENRDSSLWARDLLYAVTALLLAREIIEMQFYGLIHWMKNPVHWLEVTYCYLLLLCITGITRYDENTWTTNQRNTVMITGGLSWIMPLLSLRIIFKSFALFLSGVLNIIKTLIPFIISGLLLIGAFAVMYQVDSLNGQESFKICNATNESSTQLWNCTMATPTQYICSLIPVIPAPVASTKVPLSQSCPYWESFGNLSYNVLGSFQQDFFTKPTTKATRGLSISFAILAVILLLNVIIAIINQKWEDVTSRGLKVFWGERARYSVFGPYNGDIWNKILSDICNVLTCKVTLRERLCGIISVPFYSFIIVIWLVYGVFTFGILWPRTVRKFFCRIFPPGKNMWLIYRNIFVDQTDRSLEDPTEKLWDILLEWIRPKREYTSFLEKLTSLVKFIFAAFVMSIWLIFGLLFGLWPRQVREYIFCPKIEKEEKNACS